MTTLILFPNLKMQEKTVELRRSMCNRDESGQEVYYVSSRLSKHLLLHLQPSRSQLLTRTKLSTIPKALKPTHKAIKHANDMRQSTRVRVNQQWKNEISSFTPLLTILPQS